MNDDAPQNFLPHITPGFIIIIIIIIVTIITRIIDLLVGILLACRSGLVEKNVVKVFHDYTFPPLS